MITFIILVVYFKNVQNAEIYLPFKLIHFPLDSSFMDSTILIHSKIFFKNSAINET